MKILVCNGREIAWDMDLLLARLCGVFYKINLQSAGTRGRRGDDLQEFFEFGCQGLILRSMAIANNWELSELGEEAESAKQWGLSEFGGEAECS